MNAIGRVRVLGPLALHADGVRLELSRLGYALGTVENQIRVMAHLSQWMADEGVEPSELSQDRVEQFLAVLRTQWKRPPTAQTLRPMLAWFRECRFVTPLTTTTPRTPVDVLLEQYHDWLVEVAMGDRVPALAVALLDNAMTHSRNAYRPTGEDRAATQAPRAIVLRPANSRVSQSDASLSERTHAALLVTRSARLPPRGVAR